MDGFNFHRKLFHLIGFFVPGVLFFDLFKDVSDFKYPSRAILFIIITIILIGMSVIETIRLHNDSFNQLYLKLFRRLMKKEEIHRMNGVIPYMASNLFIVSFFPSQIIFLSMAYLLIGDPVAAFFGAKYGKFRFSNGKSVLGVIAFIIGSVLAGIVLMVLFQASYGDSYLSIQKNGATDWSSIQIMILGAISASIAEFKAGHAWKGFLEDNFLIPVVASLILASLTLIYGTLPAEELFFPIVKLFSH
jgi:dolichol kinase